MYDAGEWRNMADAQDSGSCEGNLMGVQVPPRPQPERPAVWALKLRSHWDALETPRGISELDGVDPNLIAATGTTVA